MTAIYDGTYGVLFPDGTSQSTASPPSIASGQTWQNVISNRVLNVFYINETPRPIQLLINRPGGNGATLSLKVGSTTSNTVVAASTGIDQYGGSNTVSVIVPPGYWYINEGNSNPSAWYELR